MLGISVKIQGSNSTDNEWRNRSTTHAFQHWNNKMKCLPPKKDYRRLLLEEFEVASFLDQFSKDLKDIEVDG